MVLPLEEEEEDFQIRAVEGEGTKNIMLVMMKFLLVGEEHRHHLYIGRGLWGDLL
jgi:hypothetical protein